MNRTYTVFFSEDDDSIRNLEDAYSILVANWQSRLPYMNEDASVMGNMRLTLLRHSIEFLKEKVPE